MKNLFTKKVLKMTLVISLIHLLLLILVSCLDEATIQDPFGECPPPRPANAIGLKIQFFPYENLRYSLETDTVLYVKFGIVLELTPELISENQVGKFPGRAFALSCAPWYNFRNISNIAIILTAPFAGIQNGTDISYLLELPDKTKLSELRDFQNTSNFFSLTLNKEPANFERLKTKTILFLRNGTQLTFDSTSPAIQTR
jgi:hypothetical protein